MNASTDEVFEFEQALKNCRSNKSILYAGNKNVYKNEYKIDDVILGVSKQITALQNADSIKKHDTKVQCKMKSQFLPLNMLSNKKLKQEIQKKFETQCISDTQFIHLVQNIEAQEDRSGVTQEFEITFCQKSDDSVNPEIESKESPKKIGIQSNKDNNLSNSNSNFEPTVSNNYSGPVQNSCYINTNISFEGDGCQAIREFSDVEESELFAALDDMVKSPILGKIRPIVIKSTTPFVYPLECFEKFETLAHAIIDEHPDLLVAKKLINSQIENKELFIKTNMDPFIKNESVDSPLLKSNTFTKTNSEISMPTSNFLEKKSQQSIIEDTILFSSDEENEYFSNEEDLPLTCPVQTSFYNCTDVLDKTMYVGFQTASNKTIQVNSDSFIMAQNILNGDEHENVAFTNPVEIFKTSNDMRNGLPTENVSTYQNMDFVGFKKANGKSIHLSKEALLKGTELLNNIEENLNKSFDNNLKRQFKSNSIKSTKRVKYTENSVKNHKYLPNHIMDENDKKLQVTKTKDNIEEYNILKINDENIIQEFETNLVEESESNIKNLQNSKSLNELKMPTLKSIQISHQSLESTNQIFEYSYDSGKTVPNNNLPGFTTASNKNISVSKKALLKCKNIFDGIDDVEDNPKTKFDESDPKLPRPIGFSTASYKKIKISRKALLKSKKIFEDIDIDNNLDQKNKRHVDKTHLEKNVNFERASNKVVSKKTFARSATIFRDISDDNIESVKNTSNKVYKPGIELQDFRTANNNPIKVSPKSVDKHIFQNFDDYENNINENEIKPNIYIKSPYSKNIKILNKKSIPTCYFDTSQKLAEISDAELITNHKILSEHKENSFLFRNCKISGFQTAGKKKINISKEKLANCLKVFDGIDLNINDELPSSISTSPSFNRINTVIKPSANSTSAIKSKESHFKTASINVNKSEDGTEILGGINLEIESKLKENHFSQTKNSLDLGKCVFHTANNKPISISDEAIEASQRLIKKINNGAEMFEKNSKNSPFVGFKTGSNRNIAISEKTLDKAKKFFDHIDETSSNLNEAVCAQMETKFQFQTANNKPVNISEKSYEASQRLINPTDSVKVIVKNNGEFQQFVGIKTASNNDIVISKETFDKAKKIFDGIDETSLINLCKTVSTPTKTMFQFQTANNKVVNISEEAIIASQRQLNTDLSFKEFQTASNKEVKISKTSLARTKVFDEIDSETVNQNKDFEESKDINLKNILNTQVISNFEETLYTEDFLKEPTPTSKRSGSPILSYSKTKKQKFKAPASNTLKNLLKTDSCHNDRTSTFIFDRSYKKNKGFKLKDLNVLEEKYKSENKNIDPYIHNFNFENILEFEFLNGRNDLTAVKLRTEDIKEIFLKSVNKTIIPTGWIENHLKLIMWKLLSYEAKYPNVFYKVCTAKSVIEQLKYRYDKELYNVQRPALRKILEKDDISSKTIALCVVGIYVDGVYVSSVANTTETIELLLTDGWYCVKACIDKLLLKYVFEGKISVGTKLVTHGAELVNCEQGISPWEDTSSVRLKIFGNSTRRARWDARLGYHGNAAMLTQLISVKPDGGKVSKLRVFVTRVYPTLYVERFDDGSTVTRSERLENLHQMKYESERQIILEKIYEDIEKEFCDQDSEDSDNTDIDKTLETGSQIARAMKKHQDPAEFMAMLTAPQRRNLDYYTNRQNDKVIEKVQQKVREKIRNSALGVTRNVVPLMKVRVASVDKDLRVSKGMISIWRPNEELQEVITEGKWIQAYNVIPTAVRYSEIQLSASRQSIFQSCLEKDPKKNKIVGSLMRRCYFIRDLLKNPHLSTDYNEIDTVGFVFLIEPLNKDFETSKQLFQNVYLADEDKNIICINFWGGIKKFGFQNNLDMGEIVACVNLQKRSGNIMKSIPQYRAIEFSYFTKTPKYECLRKSSDALMKILSGLDKKKFRDDCVATKNNLALFKCGNDVSPYRMNQSDYNISKNRIFIDSPFGKEANWDLSGLDFESTFKLRDTQDISPQELLRKKKVNDKIAKLKMYGEPPPLSPLNIIKTSNNAVSAFKSPLTTQNNLQVTIDDTSSTIDKENSKHESSPVLSFRKFGKRLSVNPVKLNFNNENESNTVDPFGDDFDASLPLSLD